MFNGLGERDPGLVHDGLETVHGFHVDATTGKPGTARHVRDLHTAVLATIADQLGLAN